MTKTKLVHKPRPGGKAPRKEPRKDLASKAARVKKTGKPVKKRRWKPGSKLSHLIITNIF